MGYNAEYYSNQKERFKGYRDKYNKKNPTYVICHNAKRRAKEQGVPYDLRWKELSVPSVCPVLGIPIYVGTGASSDNSPSIDKIIPEKGYVHGNVAIISSRANRLKNDATLAELKALVAYLESFSSPP